MPVEILDTGEHNGRGDYGVEVEFGIKLPYHLHGEIVLACQQVCDSYSVRPPKLRAFM